MDVEAAAKQLREATTQEQLRMLSSTKGLKGRKGLEGLGLPGL